MPTPFYHCEIAQAILNDERLPENARALLTTEREAFYFGKTAPDVQVVAGTSRASTHFFDIPFRMRTPPWERMLKKYPSLGAEALSPTRRAFIAGYQCHLQADWLWIQRIFIPFFGPDARWLNFRKGLYYHNAMRAYLDTQLIDSLPEDLGAWLGSVQPDGWLPFAKDDDLIVWRDLLTRQLVPGGKIETIDVFAARGNVPPEEMLALIEDEAAMDELVFSRIPRETLIEYRDALVTANIERLAAYLATE